MAGEMQLTQHIGCMLSERLNNWAEKSHFGLVLLIGHFFGGWGPGQNACDSLHI